MKPQFSGSQSVIESILGAVSSLLPSGMVVEARTNLAQSLKAELERMDIATRSELEVQETALRRARATVKELEQRVLELEQRLKDAD